MDEEKIRFRLRFRYLEKNSVEAEIIVSVPYEDRSDVGYDGRSRRSEEEASVATKTFTVTEPYDYHDAKKDARLWAARGIAKAFEAFFAADPQAKGS